jgi:hypothetical protein
VGELSPQFPALFRGHSIDLGFGIGRGRSVVHSDGGIVVFVESVDAAIGVFEGVGSSHLDYPDVSLALLTWFTFWFVFPLTAVGGMTFNPTSEADPIFPPNPLGILKSPALSNGMEAGGVDLQFPFLEAKFIGHSFREHEFPHFVLGHRMQFIDERHS